MTSTDRLGTLLAELRGLEIIVPGLSSNTVSTVIHGGDRLANIFETRYEPEPNGFRVIATVTRDAVMARSYPPSRFVGSVIERWFPLNLEHGFEFKSRTYLKAIDAAKAIVRECQDLFREARSVSSPMP